MVHSNKILRAYLFSPQKSEIKRIATFAAFKSMRCKKTGCIYTEIPAANKTFLIPISGQLVSSSRLRIERTTDRSPCPSDVEEVGLSDLLLLVPGQGWSYCVLSNLHLLHHRCPFYLCCHPCGRDLLFCLFFHLHLRTHSSFCRDNYHRIQTVNVKRLQI